MSSHKIHWTTFSSIRATKPAPLDIELETLLDILTTPREVASKKDMQNPFSFVRYKDGAKRGTEGIETVTGVVLDFDFKDSIQFDENQGENFIKTYLVERGLIHFHHVWYTTFSYDHKRPNFRLVIPFNPEQELSPSKAAEAIDKLFYWLNDYPYLDKCSKTLAQLYYPPVIRKDKGEDFFFCGGNIKGRYFDPAILEPRPHKERVESREVFHPVVSYRMSAARYFEKALEHIPSDIIHDDWIKVGMCLKSELGEAGFLLWDCWSQHGSKYAKNKKGEMQRVWSGFKKEGVSGGTLIQMAKEYGFNPQEHRALNPAASNVVPFPTESPFVFDSFDDINARILDEELIEDEHALLRDWDGLEESNIYDLSRWPFLNFLNTIFLTYAHPERHSQRLACVITVAGHVLKEYFKCPFNTNFYTLAMMPTGTFKNKFLSTIEALLTYFECGSHLIGDIGTVQGLEKHLRLSGGKMFNKVDEASTTIRTMRPQGNPNKDEIPKMLKEIFTQHTYTPRAIKGEESKVIENIYASAFWTGTERCFNALEEDDFWDGMMGRFLFFHMGDFAAFGVTNKAIQKIMDRKSITTEEIAGCLSVPFDYQFRQEVIFSQEAETLNFSFLEKCREKVKQLGEVDIRRTTIVRAQEFARKLAILTCNEKGEVSLEGMRWGIGVMINSIQVASALIQKRFYTSRSKEALERVEACIVRECQKAQSYRIRRRLVFRSLSDINIRFLEDLIDRLIKNETVREEKILNQPGSSSTVLTVIGRSLQKKIGDLKGQASEEEKLKKIRSVLSKFWQKSQGASVTQRELRQPLRRYFSKEELYGHLQTLQTEGFLTIEDIVRKNGATTTLIHQPDASKEQKGDLSHGNAP